MITYMANFEFAKFDSLLRYTFKVQLKVSNLEEKFY